MGRILAAQSGETQALLNSGPSRERSVEKGTEEENGFSFEQEQVHGMSAENRAWFQTLGTCSEERRLCESVYLD